MSKIGEINKLISRCNSCQDIHTAEKLKSDTIFLLIELECSNKVIQCCRNIYFGSVSVSPFRGPLINSLEREATQKEALEQGLVALLDLLREVRKEVIEYKLQHKAMIYSAIAAIGTLISIGITLLLHYI